MTTPAAAAAAFIAYLDELALRDNDVHDWTAGTADGGPNGDGLYPIRVRGGTRMVACPAKIAEAGGGSFSRLAIDSLPEVLDSSVEPIIPVTVPDGLGGRSLGKMGLYNFTRHHLRDLQAQSDLTNLELIPAITAGGQERLVAIDALVQGGSGLIDPSRPPYNVVYDWQRVQNAASMTAGSNIVELTENLFSEADLGRLMAVGNANNSLGVLVGYIGLILDPRHARLFTTKGGSVPANANVTVANQDAQWGTDCTEGMQQAIDDAEPTSIWTRGKIVELRGIAFVRQLRFGSVGIVGKSVTNCGFAQVPTPGVTGALLSDKITGKYATKRPHHYTLANLCFHGMRYTQYWSSFLRCLDIRGGVSFDFLDSAPYGYIDSLDFWQAQWQGAAMSGAFAGEANRLRAFFCAQVGIRCGFWDLNGTLWHAEGNGWTGIMSFMSGGNLTAVKCSFNGGSAAGTYIYEHGSNYCELGKGNIITNLRCQESWANNLIISNADPLGAFNGAGNENTFQSCKFDDTGNLGGARGVNPGGLPPVRAMVMLKGGSVTNNTVELAKGYTWVTPQNCATHGYFDMSDPSDNEINLRTPRISNDPADWFDGNGSTVPGGTGVYAPGPWGTTSSTPVGARNIVTINRVTVPKELSRLRLTATAFDPAWPTGTKIADVLGKASGSALALAAPSDGRVELHGDDDSGWSLYVGPVVSSAGAVGVSLPEALTGASNSPRPNLINIEAMAVTGLALDTMTDDAGIRLSEHAGQYGTWWRGHPVDNEALSKFGLISSAGTLYLPNPGVPVYLANAVPPSPDYYVQARFAVQTVVAGDAHGIIGRAASNALTFYLARYNGGVVQLYRVINGNFTTLALQSVTPWTVGSEHDLKLIMDDDQISVAVDGATVVDVTDSSPLTGAGAFGLRLLCSTAQTPISGTHITRFEAAAL